MNSTDPELMLLNIPENLSDKLGKYILNILNNTGFDQTLTKILQKYFEPSVDGSTYRESFISVVVSIIGDYDVLQEFLKEYNGEYQIVTCLENIPTTSKDFCVYSEEGDTHYRTCINGISYDSYDYGHQLPYTNGFCQTFSIIKSIKNKELLNDMEPSHYVNNSLNALKFIPFILQKPSLKKSLQRSLNNIYKEHNAYDLKNTSKLTLTVIKKIIGMFKRIDIYPGLLSSACDIGISDNVINDFIKMDCYT